MCMISIPFLSEAADGVPLQRCLDQAAERSGVDVYTMALAMSYFIEAIADEVTHGRSVRVPGFGLFAPVPIPDLHLRMSRDTSPRCKPVFLPSRGFRAQVASGAAPSDIEAKRAKQFRKNHAGCRAGDSVRVFTAQQAFREQVEAQLAGARS